MGTVPLPLALAVQHRGVHGLLLPLPVLVKTSTELFLGRGGKQKPVHPQTTACILLEISALHSGS